MTKRWLQIMVNCAWIGIALSTYAFLHNKGFAEGSICTINATINCDIVNKGPYSEIAGVPVALIGIIGYIFLFVGALAKMKTPNDRSITTFLLMTASGGFAFSLYLTFLEAFVLRAWCLVCLSSQLVMLLYLIGVVGIAKEERKILRIQDQT